MRVSGHCYPQSHETDQGQSQAQKVERAFPEDQRAPV